MGDLKTWEGRWFSSGLTWREIEEEGRTAPRGLRRSSTTAKWRGQGGSTSPGLGPQRPDGQMWPAAYFVHFRTRPPSFVHMLLMAAFVLATQSLIKPNLCATWPFAEKCVTLSWVGSSPLPFPLPTSVGTWLRPVSFKSGSHWITEKRKHLLQLSLPHVLWTWRESPRFPKKRLKVNNGESSLQEEKGKKKGSLQIRTVLGLACLWSPFCTGWK